MPDIVKNVQSDRLFAFWQFPATCVRACGLISSSLFTPSVSPLSLRFPVRLYCTPPCTRTRTDRSAYTHFCFSWYFSVISSNTTLSSCLITEQGYNICLHELPSACVCVWSLFLSISRTHTRRYLSMPPGSWTQLSFSLILSPHPPYSGSSLPSSLTPHPFFFSFSDSLPRFLSLLLFSLLLFFPPALNNAHCLWVQVRSIFRNDRISSYTGESITRGPWKSTCAPCCLVCNGSDINRLPIGHTPLFGFSFFCGAV